MWTRALAPIRNTEAIERDVRRQGESTERLYLFLKNETELAALKEPGEDPKTLFGYLESLFLCDLIDEVRVTVERTDDEQRQLMRLAAELNDLGVSRTHPNPYFELFANALARRRPPEPELELSKKELDAQTELADEVLEEILAEEQADETGKGP